MKKYNIATSIYQLHRIKLDVIQINFSLIQNCADFYKLRGQPDNSGFL